MRFKNYINPYTKENRIYSYRDLYDMPFGEFIKRKQEVLSQYSVLGVPTEKELQGSDNVVYVEAYTREDGTEVKAHYRSKPNSGVGVNKSSANPTDKVIEDKETEFEKIEKEQLESKEENTSEEQAQKQTEQKTEQTPEDKDKRLYPDEVAGVKRGEPKTFEQMIQQGVNPKYMSEEDEKGDYSNNCQCCTVAAELVIRGYDVEAGPYSTTEAKELGHSSKSAYLDPETGKECIPNIIYYNEISCIDYLEQNVKQGERYELSYNTPTESGNKEYDKEHEFDGHVVIITRNENHELEYYDPQNGERARGKGVKDILEPCFQYKDPVAPPRILRIDDKALNPKYINAVVKKRNGM